MQSHQSADPLLADTLTALGKRLPQPWPAITVIVLGVDDAQLPPELVIATLPRAMAVA